MTVLLTGAYLAAVTTANLLAAAYGPAVTPWTALALIGLDLTCRDTLHHRWQHRRLPLRMAALLATGSLLAWAANHHATRVAVASAAAFALASATDALVYATRRQRPWLDRANTSNLAGATVDSVVFPTLAFGGLLPPIVAGQLAAKVLGGAAWSLVLHPRRRHAAAGHQG
jgi:hypothetical protein